MSATVGFDGRTLSQRWRWVMESYLGITQLEMAERLGVAPSGISKVLSAGDPREATVQAWAEETGLERAFLRYGLLAPVVDQGRELEELVDVLDSLGILRPCVNRIPVVEVVQAAYSVAVTNGLSSQALRRLDSARDAVMSRSLRAADLAGGH